MRNRIGKKQQALLLHLELVGPIIYEELSQSDQRSIKSLGRQGKVKAKRSGPYIVFQLKE